MKIKSWLLVLALIGFITAGNAQKHPEKPLPPTAPETKMVNRKFLVPPPPPPPEVKKEDIAPPPPPPPKEKETKQ